MIIIPLYFCPVTEEWVYRAFYKGEEANGYGRDQAITNLLRLCQQTKNEKSFTKK